MTTAPKLITVLINLITTLIEGLLVLRIILKLFGASTAASFVRWIYETSEPLLTPFVGMFPSPRLTSGFVVEFSSLFALMIYAFIGYLAAEMLETLIYYARERQEKNAKK